MKCRICSQPADFDNGEDAIFPCGTIFDGPLCTECFDDAYDTHKKEGGGSRNPMNTSSCRECLDIEAEDMAIDFSDCWEQ